MQAKLDQIKASFQKELLSVSNEDSLREIEIKYLGRKCELTMLLRGLAQMSDADKRTFGKAANVLKLEITEQIENKRSELGIGGSESTLDVTLPVEPLQMGKLNPLTSLQYEIEDIMRSMGFMVAEGPELESEYFNFEALNVPATHPARDMQDTFWLEDGNLLRTQTSPVQIRTMLAHGAPLRMICPGKVFRYEAMDASHSHTFFQVEGLMLDEDTNISHMKAVMAELLSTLFGKEVKVRLRPGYFPFVEPGMELDFSCLLCGGKGCRVCKHTGWVEFMGCGMVHPKVLEAGHIDPKKYQGFAFGFGLDRLAMMRYGIHDIRLFYEGDIRFTKQF
ncbi:MAG: phenylalanine--tRNA ligase subunit alpha [Candidatus Gracilibacteria bacterium]|nr:phenylalanine--tRNA ligase subunit alpha [Candidatus Gracilibacteria bacterium]